MGEIDKNDRLKNDPFSYKITKSNKTLIYYENRLIKTLKEKETKKFQNSICGKDNFEVQLVLARITGNFKRGNEGNKK